MDEPTVKMEEDDAATQPSPFTWKSCDNLTPLNQVELLESAATHGTEFLRELDSCLERIQKKVPHAKEYRARVDEVLRDKKKCQIMVGFLGTTGAGKSSLINACLGYKIVPSSSQDACTSVCVEIRYNFDENPLRAFRAIVHRISIEDWRSEIEKLFQDISDDAQNLDGDDGEPDTERKLRIDSAFQKLRCVYPFINVKDDLRKQTPESLVNHANVNSILGKTAIIEESVIDTFTTNIRPFINTQKTVTKDGSFEQWPLVKLVELEVKSALLVDGICLVDLPGSHDTSLARGAIADSYLQKLTVSVVVARVHRAVADPNAQSLLGKVRQHTKQMDGKFSTDRICFVVSCCDDLEDCNAYIKEHSLEAELKKEFDEQAMLEAKMSECVSRIQEATSAQQNLLTQCKTLQSTKRKAVVEFNKKSSTKYGNLKRKRDQLPIQELHGNETAKKQFAKILEIDDALVAGQAQEKEASLQLAIAVNGRTRVLEKETKLASRFLRGCMTNRSKFIAEKLRTISDEATKVMGKNYLKKGPLQVFCVSALGYNKLSSHNTLAGFIDIDDTGIPAFQKWLIQTTLSTRQTIAENYLESIITIQMAIQPWISDYSTEYRIQVKDAITHRSVFTEYLQKLSHNLDTSNSELIRVCQDMIKSGVHVKMREAEKAAANAVEGIVRSWAQKPVRWMTHRAINKGFGSLTNTKLIKFDWNGDLMKPYTEALMPEWTYTIHQRFPQTLDRYGDEIEEYIGRLVKDMAGLILQVHPGLKPGFEAWKNNSLRTIMPIHQNALNIFATTVTQGSNAAHRLLESKIQAVWNPVYEECGKESGEGHFKRNQLAHINHALKLLRKPYEQGSLATKNALKETWDQTARELEQGTQNHLQQIVDQFEIMLRNYTISDMDFDGEAAASAKHELSGNVRSLEDKLSAAWRKPFVMPEEVVKVEEEESDLDDLFVRQNEDEDDDDYEEDEGEVSIDDWD